MDKIGELLVKLENKVTPTIAKKLDGFNNLEKRLEVAKKDLEANPDDQELKEAFEEITDYVSDYRENLIEALEELVEAKERQKEADSKPKGEEKPKEEKESSTNIAGWIFGGLLLIGSLGAINYFRNNR